MNSMTDSRIVPTSEIIDITPQQATKWLERNVNNRPLNADRVKTIAAAILRNEWTLNGDSVKLSLTGRLLDGQHRLSAIVVAGRPCRSLIVRNLPDETFKAIDTNRMARQARDVLAMEGIQNATTHASAARMLFYYENYGHPFVNEPVTIEQVNAIALNRPGMAEAVSYVCGRLWLKKHMTPTLAAFCRYVFMKQDADIAAKFFDELVSGVGLAKGSPVLLLRERLLGGNASNKAEMHRAYRGALVFKAFRLYREGATAGVLRVGVSPGGAVTREQFQL